MWVNNSLKDSEHSGLDRLCSHSELLRGQGDGEPGGHGGGGGHLRGDETRHPGDV